jgi:hypothetical protein
VSDSAVVSSDGIIPGESLLAAGWASSSDDYLEIDAKYRTFLKFDLSEFEPNEIESAKLLINESSCGSFYSGGDLTLHRVTASWSGASATWANQATIGSSIATSSGSSCGDWLSIDITTAAQNWASGSWQNYGLRVQGDESEEDTDRYFDATDGANAPFLLINDDEFDPEPSVLAEGSCGGLEEDEDPLAAEVDWTDYGASGGLENSPFTSSASLIHASNQAYLTCSSVPERFRWVKIASMHVSQAMRARVLFYEGRETRAQGAIESQAGNFSVGSWETERDERTSENSYFHVGPFHRNIVAGYQFGRYVHEGNRILPWWQWDPKWWNGDLKPLSTTLGQPAMPSSPAYRVDLSVDELFTRKKGSNKTFESGWSIGGISLKSKAGYTKQTVMAWRGLSGCTHRYIYGVGLPPPQAQVVYAKSTGCS